MAGYRTARDAARNADELETELLAAVIGEKVLECLTDSDEKLSGLINRRAARVLEEVRLIICDDSIKDDFAVVEKIVAVLRYNKIDTNNRHLR